MADELLDPVNGERDKSDELTLRDRLGGKKDAATRRVVDARDRAARAAAENERLAKLTQQTRQAAELAREDPLHALARAAQASQDSRLAAEEASKPTSLAGKLVKKSLNNVVGNLARAGAESVPVFGDGLSLIQWATGYDTGFNKIDKVERWFYFFGGILPVPALPFVWVLKYWRKRAEQATLSALGHKLGGDEAPALPAPLPDNVVEGSFRELPPDEPPQLPK